MNINSLWHANRKTYWLSNPALIEDKITYRICIDGCNEYADEVTDNEEEAIRIADDLHADSIDICEEGQGMIGYIC